MSTIASLSAAFIPMVLYLILIWKLDKYEPEPLSKVVNHFIWGALGAVLFGLILSSSFNFVAKLFISEETALSFFGAVIIAPFVEEIVKSAYLFRTYKKNYFDNLTDGLVYGGAIGLGFGMTENFLYFMVYDETFYQWLSVVITRSIFSAVMHAIATAVVGAFLSRAKFSFRKKNFLPMLGLLIAMIIHAAWNFSLSFEFTYFLGILFMIFLILSFFGIFSLSLNNEKTILIKEFIDDEIFYPEHRGNSIMEINNQILNLRDRRKYLNFATKIAFRKLQARNSIGSQREFYMRDIENLRKKIINIWEKY